MAKALASVKGISGVPLWYRLNAHAYIRLTPAHMQQMCEEPGDTVLLAWHDRAMTQLYELDARLLGLTEGLW